MRKWTKKIITASLVATMACAQAAPAMAEELGPGAALADPGQSGEDSGQNSPQTGGAAQEGQSLQTGEPAQEGQSQTAEGGQEGQSQTGENIQTEIQAPESTEPGAQVSYTPGQGTQMTNVSISLVNVKGTITYSVYVNNGGFLAWTSDGRPAGGTEDSTYVEAIRIDLTGDAAKHYDVYYTGMSSVLGQLGWAKGDRLLGTMDRGEHLYDLQVKLVPKGGAAPGPEDRRFFSQYSEGLRVEMGNTTYTNPDGSTYTGWLDHDLNRFYFLDGKALMGWHYIDGLKFFFNEDGTLLQDTRGLVGKQSNYLLKVNKALNCMTVYAKDGANGYTIPLVSMLTSVGDDTPLGTFHTPEKYRWRLMVNDTYTQYATRLTAGKGFLFHSITYNTQNADDIVNSAYNRLGINRSLGCIRLTCENAKWVYDNCAIGTEVYIYEDPNVPGPFFKPGVKQIPEDQTWDPTDPAFADR